jgi:hypothetical protein
MSHRISKKRAIMLKEQEDELRKMQKAGQKLPKSRRQKKLELMRKRQTTFITRLKDRIYNTGGHMPEHLKEEEK